MIHGLPLATISIRSPAGTRMGVHQQLRTGRGVLHTVFPVFASSAKQGGQAVLRLRAAVELDDHLILIDEQRTRAPVRAFRLAQVPRPDDFAVEVHRRDVAAGVGRIDPPAVRGGSRRGIAGLRQDLDVVRLDVAPGCSHRRPPEQLAGAAIEAHHFLLVRVRAGQEKPVSPEHRRAVARQRDRRLPQDVLAGLDVPFHRPVARLHDARPIRRLETAASCP